MSATPSTPINSVDYYEFLQISPNADHDTIHRVYRFLAARFHPDNPETGDVDTFNMLRTAYDVLSKQETKTQFDIFINNNLKHILTPTSQQRTSTTTY